jgi:hypothetical protein
LLTKAYRIYQHQSIHLIRKEQRKIQGHATPIESPTKTACSRS